MKKFRDTDVTSAIGATPIVRLRKLAAHVDSAIYLKLEFTNPGGSIKDRVGVYMCRKALEAGELAPGGLIVEGTSGNTGVGVALFSAVYGHRCILVMSDKQSADKIRYLKAFGAKVVLCPSWVDRSDPRSYHSVACEIARTLGAYHLNQHSNPRNVEAHYALTGPEIQEQTGGGFDVFVAGVGTGGTISGCGRYLKERNPALKVVGVDPEGSVIAEFHGSGTTGTSSPYRLEGIGDGFVPDNVDLGIIDAFEVVDDRTAFLVARELLTREGIFAGGSSGAAVAAAIRYAERLSSPARILVMLPDSGDRYTSQLYCDTWMAEVGHLPEAGDDPLSGQLRSVIGDRARLA